MDRLLREFKVEASVGRPQVAYRETITRTAKYEGRYVRQTGGRGQYGHVKISVEPNQTGKGLEFVNKIMEPFLLEVPPGEARRQKLAHEGEESYNFV